MREDCKHFQSRTYNTGEVARICVLDLAPEAPWHCPDNCPMYEKRLADVGWTHGSLVSPPVESEPDEPTEAVTEILGEAEEIVNSVAPAVLAEFEREQSQNPLSRLARRFRRRGGQPGL